MEIISVSGPRYSDGRVIYLHVFIYLLCILIPAGPLRRRHGFSAEALIKSGLS